MGPAAGAYVGSLTPARVVASVVPVADVAAPLAAAELGLPGLLAPPHAANTAGVVAAVSVRNARRSMCKADPLPNSESELSRNARLDLADELRVRPIP